MSTCKKGLDYELKYSRSFHQKGTAVLVSPLILRELGLGQLDSARLIQKRLEICELKVFGELSQKQKLRLVRTANYLAELLDTEVSLRLERP